MHIAWMDLCIEHGMTELKLRTTAMVEARDEMQKSGGSLAIIPEDDTERESETQPRTSLEIDQTSIGLMQKTIRCLEAGPTGKCVAALTWAALIAPAAAMDGQMVLGSAFPVPDVTLNQSPTIALGGLLSVLFLYGGLLMGVAKSLLGPMMGISSLLYFMMRNDSAVEPAFAWW